LSSVDVNLLEEHSGSLWDRDVQKLEILDLSEESDENWVKVDFDEPFLSMWSLLSYEKELVELVLSVVFNSLLPLLDFEVVVLIEVLAKGLEELLDVFILFSILYRLRKDAKLVHWFLDSLNETLSPVDGPRNWWQV